MESSHKGFTDVDYILRHKRILFNTFSENLWNHAGYIHLQNRKVMKRCLNVWKVAKFLVNTQWGKARKLENIKICEMT
jgi:hypothetical protein